MSLGLDQKLNILRESPLDLLPAAAAAAAAPDPEAVRWVPSRYTVRAATADGRLILWNTFNGAMTVLRSDLKAMVEALLVRKGFSAKAKGMIKYLAERGFVVREGTDEYRRIQAGFGAQHYRNDRLELILLASEDCNFRCPYCYEDFLRGTMQPWVREGIKRLVTRRAPGLGALQIAWFGGEPLYGLAAIEDLAPFFVETANRHAIELTCGMTTNGYLLTPDVAENLLAWKIRNFQVTLDGTPEDHDRHRPARDGRGTFWTIFENLVALHRRTDDFRVDLRVNFDRQNQGRLGEFLTLAQERFGADDRFRLRFTPIGKWGGPNDGELATCGTGEAQRLRVELKNEARRRGLVVADDILKIQGMGTQVCYAARPYNFIVGASGKLMKCTIDLDKHDRNVVGQLTADGETQLDIDKFALWTEPAFEHDGKCQKCVVLPVCQGTHCPLVRIETGKSPCTPLRKTYKHELRGAVAAMGAAPLPPAAERAD